MASHELRSPVGTILVAASLIIREDVQHDHSGGSASQARFGGTRSV